MKTFDGIKEIYGNLFGISGDVWVKRENLSPETIETCNGVARKDEETHTCALCVALNQTVFRNNNKPDYYHYHCKCKNKKYNLTKIIEEFPFKKITDYLFLNNNKTAMMKSMGYDKADAKYIYDLLSKIIERKFLAGDYTLRELNINGQHIEISFNLQGKKDHEQEVFVCHSGCVVWPYGKIKIATPLIKG